MLTLFFCDAPVGGNKGHVRSPRRFLRKRAFSYASERDFSGQKSRFCKLLRFRGLKRRKKQGIYFKINALYFEISALYFLRQGM